jgi:hypothetical protein
MLGRQRLPKPHVPLVPQWMFDLKNRQSQVQLGQPLHAPSGVRGRSPPDGVWGLYPRKTLGRPPVRAFREQRPPGRTMPPVRLERTLDGF